MASNWTAGGANATATTASDDNDMSEQQIIIISVTGACGAFIIFTLVVIIYALLYKRRPPHRYNSQLSVARSDFWPFSTVQSPPPTLYSPDHSRRVFFEDDNRNILVPHQHGVPHKSRSRANSVATLERGSKDLTSLHQPRFRTGSDSGILTSLYSPCYVKLMDSSGLLLNRVPREDFKMAHFNRGAFMTGHDPFLWRAGPWEAPH